MSNLKVCAITATKGRHTCLERVVGFFLAQDYENKVLLIYNNHTVPQKLALELENDPRIILVNNHIDKETGSEYKILGAIYRDAMAHVPNDADIICFMDDDDAYTPVHFSEGVLGYENKPFHCRAYRPDKFFSRYNREWIIDRGQYAEPAIFVEANWVRNFGFDMVTGAQHHGWLRPLLDQELLHQKEDGIPTLIIDWSQEIPTWKTSGDVNNPSNWENYITHSQDHGDQIISATDPTSYYMALLEKFPEYNFHLDYKPAKQEIMHAEVDQFIENVKRSEPSYFENTKVLEVGSLDINGSVRKYFNTNKYLGIDIGEGPGVDLVTPIHELITPEKFDVVISTEMLEHDQHWEKSLKQMYANLRKGGLLIITCAGPARHEHGTKRTTPGDSPFTTDYYRNITKEDILSVLPDYFFNSYTAEHVRGDTDTQFSGIKAENPVPQEKKDLVFITAQPDDRTFAWETEVQIHNLAQWGLDNKLIVLVYWTPGVGKLSINPDWIDMKLRYPQVEFQFYKEDPKSSAASARNWYSSIIRPYCLGKYWEANPDMKDKAVFYLDSDVIFLQRPDIDFLSKGPSYITNTRGYLGIDYMQRKAKEVGANPDILIELAANIVGISIEDIKAQDNDCGGAQYVLKDVTAEFWKKVEKDCMMIKHKFAEFNQRNFIQKGIEKGISAEDAGIQSWCADMWAVLYNLYYLKQTVKAPAEMKSIWSENKISRITDPNDQEMFGAKILHNVGSGVHLFSKTDYRNTDRGVGKYYNQFPWDIDYSHVDAAYCSYNYVQAIKLAGKKRAELIANGH